MPLILAEKDVVYEIKKIGGTPEVKQHLADMGFAVGTELVVVSSIAGDVIVTVKGTRFALSTELASKIMV